MATISKLSTGCAGEHFVAYRLSAMNYLVALTRGGSPAVDLMVATPNGEKTVTIQVKTMIQARFKSGWNWRLSSKAKELCGESVFYAFVNLNDCVGEPSGATPKPDKMPEIFIIPADIVKSNLATFPHGSSKPTDFWFNIIENERDITDKLKGIWAEHGKWHEAWHLIKERLGDDGGLLVEQIESSDGHLPLESLPDAP